ncbi:MAG: hypothetical protein E7Z97_06360 [Propionibacteriaceae bacterium]|nr:hypothetical protein [Propionibacteriaceae bacterium]
MSSAEAAAPPPVRVFGVRHHGPGSARALAAALDAYAPDCVLIEGPADADKLIEWVADPAMRPPVALLAWQTDRPANAAFWPMAVFSPEWQALGWAARNGAETHFMDLPAAMALAATGRQDPDEPDPDDAQGQDPAGGELPEAGADRPTDDPEGPAGEAPEEDPRAGRRTDPIAELARIAGYDDPEAWWEDAVELRGAGDPFYDLTEAIGLLREATPETDPRTLRREAHMRKVLRAARRRGHERVAVVCGAWHAPALAGPAPTLKADNALLKGLPKVKTALTWVPWTHGRLATVSGYGAGIDSPGWYHHLFTAPDEPVARWFTLVARSMREHDLPVSSAHVIEASRLADALAALRGRPQPGLAEASEATWSVLCAGSSVQADLVTREVVVGQALGEVPPGVPMVPLDADLRATARSLRLTMSATKRTITLDLRKPNDLAKSRLLRRLAILGIDWGEQGTARGTGTFKEAWELLWDPEFSVAVIEAAAFGNTVASAAGNALLTRTSTLPEVTAAVEQALLADLGEVLPELLATLDERAAGEPDVLHLLQSIPALARSMRYGDVRGTDTRALGAVAQTVLTRACAGLPAAASGTSEDAAETLRRVIDDVQGVVALLDERSGRLWHDTLRSLLASRTLPGLLSGRIVRLLLDAGRLTADEAARRLGRALSPGAEPERQAHWIEGFLAGSALLLLEDRQLLTVIDEWATGIPDEAFRRVLPALRRAFGTWSTAERRMLAGRVAHLGDPQTHAAEAAEDLLHAGPVLETVGAILGGGR